MNVNYDELIMLAGGAFVMVFGIGKLNERKKILAKGVKVEGVVFDIEKNWDMDAGDTSTSTQYYPVIRYVTAEKEWVTKKYEVTGGLNLYKVGDKVTVVYDPDEIEHFIIDDGKTKWLGPLFIVVGIALILGTCIYFFINQYPKL
ncbi:DUF3592 domain-containing protein [Mucilaginibacter sp.]|uniref:DUF3592 domain-containing protein n=1 Tax=Mucilaginibacter sp. TaxID=1882438 RepID=UPI0025FA945D|nr:DUF3592 domain-containing protein [Mucilaginibacter sp.]